MITKEQIEAGLEWCRRKKNSLHADRAILNHEQQALNERRAALDRDERAFNDMEGVLRGALYILHQGSLVPPAEQALTDPEPGSLGDGVIESMAEEQTRAALDVLDTTLEGEEYLD